jgi:hypothetical protein
VEAWRSLPGKLEGVAVDVPARFDLVLGRNMMAVMRGTTPRTP